jgi:hypothetical protein
MRAWSDEDAEWNDGDAEWNDGEKFVEASRVSAASVENTRSRLESDDGLE